MPPIVLMHGGRDHCRSWDDVAADLARDHHVIAPDLRGHGDSGWSPDGYYAQEAHLGDVAALVAARGLERFDLVAHSLGGAIALRYAALFPDQVQRLVAIEGVRPLVPGVEEEGALHDRLRRWIEARQAGPGRQARGYRSFEAAVERMRAAHPRLAPELARHLTQHGVRRDADGSWRWKYDPAIRAISPVDLGDAELHALWGRIECPTLLMFGSESWARDPAADGRIAHFRDARSLGIAAAGHWVQHDQPERFIAEVRRFLSQ